MKKIKTIFYVCLLTIVSICAFGGGCIIWMFLAVFIQPNPQVMELVFYISALVPVPFCWYLAPKISDKIL